MQGIMTFSTLEQALRAGFQICGHTDHGILVRSKTMSGWALAIVDGAASRVSRRYGHPKCADRSLLLF
jgi:hypothetical protein